MTILLTSLSSDVQQPAYIPPAKHSRYGGTMVWGTINPPTIINPVLTSHSVSAAIIPLLFDGLVRINSNGLVEPNLAKSWDISEDGLIYTFYLREEVYFHDGHECTAQDVKFTYDQMKQGTGFSIYQSDFTLVDRFEAVDRHVFRVVLKQRYPFLLRKMIRYIIPAHGFSGTHLTDSSFNYHPVGTGPFVFKRWDRSNQEIELAANSNYFEGRPFLDKIVIKVYADNAALWAALMRGELDLAKFLNRQDYEVLSKDPAFKTYQIPSGMYFAVVYNTHDPILYDRDLRHALGYAIDRQALMQSVGINGIESNGPFFPQSPGFNSEVEPASYNPVRAKLLLAGRGWNLGDDGILRKGRRPLILTMLVNHNRPDCRQMALILRQQLSEIGIGLKIVFYDDESQLTQDYIARVKPQMWLRMFLGNGNDPSDMARSWYSTSSEFGRLWSYEDAVIDQLFEQGRMLKDGQQRADLYRKMHALIYDDQPACFLFFLTTFHAVSTRIQNMDIFFSPHMPDYLIKHWYILQERR
ncbi:MAG: ABC transporter substrate-binding protein [Candidatus Omnitrophica bacterium]|nr:ABC transporter substrate-binding protein [Candidatus Omnitrophota bacterium]